IVQRVPGIGISAGTLQPSRGLGLSEWAVVVIIASRAERLLWSHRSPRARAISQSGQVAQLVERSPEKAGVGGSVPSLATILKHINQQLTDRLEILYRFCTSNPANRFVTEPGINDLPIVIVRWRLIPSLATTV